MIAHAPCRIDEVERRPIVITEPTPDRAVVVDRNGIRDASLRCGLSHVVEGFLKREFWCVDADDDQPLFFVPRGPGADVWQRPKPIDAGVGPEVDEDDLALQVRRCQWR